MIFAQWHGGPSYSTSYGLDNLEVFPTLSAARAALVDRERFGYYTRQGFAWADGGTEYVYTPVVSDSRMLVYLADPREAHDPYPDRELTIGPRGGVRTERV